MEFDLEKNTAVTSVTSILSNQSDITMPWDTYDQSSDNL